MSLQTPNDAYQKMSTWFEFHRNVAKTDRNIGLLTDYIRKYFAVAGETIINETFLDMAYETVKSQMEHLESPETQQQIAELQRREKDRLAAEAEQRKKDELRNRLISAQDASFPGAASAYRGKEIVEQDQARQAAERVKAAQRSVRHDAFIQEMRAANQFLVTMPNGMVKWGSTNSERARLKNEIRQRYPEFRSEVD